MPAQDEVNSLAKESGYPKIRHFIIIFIRATCGGALLSVSCMREIFMHLATYST